MARESAPPASPEAESTESSRVLELWDRPLQAACLEALYRNGASSVGEIHQSVEDLRKRLCNRENIASRLRVLHERGLVVRSRRRYGDARHMWVYDLSPATRRLARPCGKAEHQGPCSPWSHRYRQEVPA